MQRFWRYTSSYTWSLLVLFLKFLPKKNSRQFDKLLHRNLVAIHLWSQDIIWWEWKVRRKFLMSYFETSSSFSKKEGAYGIPGMIPVFLILITIRNTGIIHAFSIAIVFCFTRWFRTVRDTFAIDAFGISRVFRFTCLLIAVRNAFPINTCSITIFLFAFLFLPVRNAFTINTFNIAIISRFA